MSTVAMAKVDWTPIRYLNKALASTVLAGLYRTAQVGVVTPLHDGMNLVAKEYVAHKTLHPGVLGYRNSLVLRTSWTRLW